MNHETLDALSNVTFIEVSEQFGVIAVDGRSTDPYLRAKAARVLGLDVPSLPEAYWALVYGPEWATDDTGKTDLAVLVCRYERVKR